MGPAGWRRRGRQSRLDHAPTNLPAGANGAGSRPSSRFGQLPPEPVDYTPTEPLLVVEIDTDVCFEPGPMVFRRLRLDLQADEVVSAP